MHNTQTPSPSRSSLYPSPPPRLRWGAEQIAVNRFQQSALSIEGFGKEEDGTEVLIPLTSSLYVPGKLASGGKALVDIGTGFLVEKTAKEGSDYCERKVALLRENQEKLADIINEKRRQLGQVEGVLQRKIAMMRQKQAEGAAAAAAA